MVDQPRRLDDPVDSFHPGDSIFEAYQPHTEVWVDGDDGLPVPADLDDAPAPPPLSPETLVCLEQCVEPTKLPKWLDRHRNRIARLLALMGQTTRAEALLGRLPRCVYYKRCLTPLGGFRDQRQVERWCIHPGQKTLSGGGLSLSDSAMYACEMRQPAFATSGALLDELDEKRIAKSKDKKFWRIFRTAEEAARGVNQLGENEYEDKANGL